MATTPGKGISFLNFSGKFSEMALALMLMGILFPAALYSFQLRNPSPAQLLVAISITLFAGVLYLWILDATSILRFRSEWISKSIYGAAITSVLGTSVGVYKDSFGDDQFPLRGKWQVSIIDTKRNNQLSTNDIVMGYSKNSDFYYAFSNIATVNIDSAAILYVEIPKISVEKNQIIIKIGFGNKTTIALERGFKLSGKNTEIQVVNKDSDEYQINILRPNF